MRPCLKNAIVIAMAMAAVSVAATSCFAHYLWVQQVDGAYAVCRGVIGKRLDSYDPSCVTQISTKAPDGRELSINRTNEKERVVFASTETPAIVSVTSEWGDRVNTTRGKKLMNRQAAEAAGLTVVSAFTSTQFSKTLFTPSETNCQPLGLKLELVPLADPMTSTIGMPTAFKLLFDGQPLVGMSIITNLDQQSKTDENGVAQFSFQKEGVHLLYATHKIRAEGDSGLDFVKFMTFLAFEVKQ